MKDAAKAIKAVEDGSVRYRSILVQASHSELGMGVELTNRISKSSRVARSSHSTVRESHALQYS
jgi:hypothetical protein